MRGTFGVPENHMDGILGHFGTMVETMDGWYLRWAAILGFLRCEMGFWNHPQ